MSRALNALLVLCGAAAPLAAQVRSREVAKPLSAPVSSPSPTITSTSVIRAGLARLDERPAVLAISEDTSTTSSLGIRWTPVSGAAEYRVSHAAAAGGPWGLINTLPASTTRLDDQSLAPGATIYYQVEAFSGTDGTGQLATIAGSAQTLAAPRLVVTAACVPNGNLNGENQQRCTWTWQPAPGAASYLVNDYTVGSFVCPVSQEVVLASVTGSQYSHDDIPYSSARCRHHYSFQALYVMNGFPTPQSVKGPETQWYPQ
jgi:hypothetical protein